MPARNATNPGGRMPLQHGDWTGARFRANEAAKKAADAEASRLAEIERLRLQQAAEHEHQAEAIDWLDAEVDVHLPIRGGRGLPRPAQLFGD